MARRIDLGRHTGQTRGNHRGQHILDVVLAFQAEFRSAASPSPWPRPFGRAINDHVHSPPRLPARPDAQAKTSRPWRPSGWRRRRQGALSAFSTSAILRGLRGKDALLGPRIVLKGAVAVQVVRRNVQDDGDLGMELIGAFKLEAGDLEHRPGVIGAFVDQRHDRHADVAAHERGQAGSLRGSRPAASWWWSCRWSR